MVDGPRLCEFLPQMAETALREAPVSNRITTELAKLMDGCPKAIGPSSPVGPVFFARWCFATATSWAAEPRSQAAHRYFPEAAGAVAGDPAARCVLDGCHRISAPGKCGLDFDALYLRIPPRAARVKLLAAETVPASFVAGNLLGARRRDFTTTPQAQRRQKLDTALANAKPRRFTHAGHQRSRARRPWFTRSEAPASRRYGQAARRVYQAGKRAMLKINHAREATRVAGSGWHRMVPAR